ncbi:MAG: Type 4 prepilin-like protein leader peptide-processing enzyme [candidate division WS6 bacterium OLB21]|uniref:Type 4 prepilin-like protein leader peptide-processing enzyme n=1 Tax=candidate division WS6 bacterium OLB21 TaxID=1617427 RepID=A0A136KHA6_9BACT|nr:MAG: Type 4 prepilin-like protein leader peptide-processing enzyme [candidate division WS6 bacterium OLB21]
MQLVFFGSFVLGFLTRTIVLSENISKAKYKFDSKNLVLDLIFATMLSLISYGLIERIAQSEYLGGFLAYLIFVIVFIVLYLLYFLAVSDLVFMSVPVLPLFVLLAVLLTVNVVLLIFLGTGGLNLWGNNVIYPVSNIVAGLILAFLVWLIVKATHEKGMGSGDIYLAGAMGLLLGLSMSFVAFYITILTATGVGLGFALYKKKLRGVPIPFVPFIVVGIITTFLLWSDLLPFVQQSLNLTFLR